uniref:Uncharacterized protein n=1 Tax=Arundo donax TaxID=35708 RepID=A0A0A9CCR7_ARUDO
MVHYAICRTGNRKCYLELICFKISLNMFLGYFNGRYAGVNR